MSHRYRAFLKSTRTLHIYITLAALLLLLFFAATGFMLNHEDWFLRREPVVFSQSGALPPSWLVEPDKLQIVERLRSEFGARGGLESFSVDDESLSVTFKYPGGTFEATIERVDGQVQVTREAWGLASRLTDLHKGKSAGPAWRLVIDAACGLLVIISLSGLVLWTSLRRRRRYGLLALAAGLAICVAIYLLFVP